MKTNSNLNFFIGIAVGIGIFFLFGKLVGLSQNPKTFRLNQTINFGNGKLWAQKAQEPITKEFEQLHFRELWMTLNDKPFLLITQNQDGKISGLHLTKNEKYPILSLKPSKDVSGKWELATYSNADETGKPVGEIYRDIDFNGQFDFKLSLNKERTKGSAFIFLDGTWKKVDSCSPKNKMAKIGNDEFFFEHYSGWSEKK